jgi:hypothetical protein
VDERNDLKQSSPVYSYTLPIHIRLLNLAVAEELRKASVEVENRRNGSGTVPEFFQRLLGSSISGLLAPISGPAAPKSGPEALAKAPSPQREKAGIFSKIHYGKIH